MDVFSAVLVDSAEATLMPEIYECLGHDKFMHFVELFGGMTIDVPSKGLFHNAARDAEMFMRHERGESDEEIAVRFKLSTPKVHAAITRIRSMLPQ